MNPLARIVRRWPKPFGLAWIDETTLVQTAPNTYDMRDVRYLASTEAQRINWPDEEKKA